METTQLSFPTLRLLTETGLGGGVTISWYCLFFEEGLFSGKGKTSERVGRGVLGMFLSASSTASGDPGAINGAILMLSAGGGVM